MRDKTHSGSTDGDKLKGVCQICKVNHFCALLFQ